MSPKIDLNKLILQVPLGPNEVLAPSGVANRYMYAIRRFAAYNPLLFRALAKVHNFYASCAAIRASDEAMARSARSAVAQTSAENPEQFGSAYGYSDDYRELQAAVNYMQEVQSGLNRQTESRKLYEYLEALLFRELEGLSIMLNFGVSYAYVDSLVARRRMDCTFVGVDRSEFTRKLNERSFSGQQNMEFLAGDVFDVLRDARFRGGALLHTRTMCLLPEEFVTRLYSACSKAGITKIVVAEQIGISRATGQAYRFSWSSSPSVPFRDGMYIHNYPGLLSAAGYEVTRAELVSTDHPHPDFRIFGCVAVAPSV